MKFKHQPSTLQNAAIDTCVDLCNTINGRYPKDFKWTGWHPNDLCYVIPIIKSEELFWMPESERGEDNEEITDVPQNFKTWVGNNQDRNAKAEQRGTLPYFVRDNRERVKGVNSIAEKNGKSLPTPASQSNIPMGTYQPSSLNSQEQKAWNENDRCIEQYLNIKAGLPMSYEEANSGKENPLYGKEEGTTINCQTCTIVHEMRRRGYDVEALPNTNWVINDIFRKEGFTWQQRFLNPDGSDVNYDFTDNWNARRKDGEMTTKKLGLYISEKISQDGRYEIYCAWEKGGGHTFCAERINGKIRFFDPQTGQNDYAYKLKEMDLNNIGIIRIDDKLINPKMMGMLRVKQS